MLTPIQEVILELQDDLFHDPIDIAAGLFDRQARTNRREALGDTGLGKDVVRKRRVHLLDAPLEKHNEP